MMKTNEHLFHRISMHCKCGFKAFVFCVMKFKEFYKV
jgi:hypothetical protein